MTRPAALLLAVVVGGCTTTHDFGTSVSRTISGDHGGYVMEYALKVLQEKGEVRITGYCGSACTLWLGHPRACVTKSARLVFHSAYGAPGRNVQFANSYMMSKYPNCIRDYIAAHGGLTRRMITMSGKQAMRCVRKCA